MAVYKRGLLAACPYDDLSGTSKQYLEAAMHLLRDLPAGNRGDISKPVDRATLKLVEATLTHRLSAHFERIIAPRTLQNKSPAEAAVLDQFRGRLATITSAHALRKVMAALAPSICIGSAIRREAIGSTADREGNYTLYPHQQHIDLCLALVVNHLTEVPSLYRAIQTYVTFTHYHPLTDGNGRVARILFNYALERCGMRLDFYVPFYELCAHSRGGFEIRLRQVQIYGEWDDFVIFACDLIRISCETRERSARTNRRPLALLKPTR